MSLTFDTEILQIYDLVFNSLQKLTRQKQTESVLLYAANVRTNLVQLNYKKRLLQIYHNDNAIIESLKKYSYYLVYVGAPHF